MSVLALTGFSAVGLVLSIVALVFLNYPMMRLLKGLRARPPQSSQSGTHESAGTVLVEPVPAPEESSGGPMRAIEGAFASWRALPPVERVLYPLFGMLAIVYTLFVGAFALFFVASAIAFGLVAVLSLDAALVYLEFVNRKYHLLGDIMAIFIVLWFFGSGRSHFRHEGQGP